MLPCLVPTLLLLALLPGCGGGASARPAEASPVHARPSMDAAEEADAQAVLAEVNRMRVAHGRSPCVWSFTASQVAYEHCVDMRRRGFFAHFDPEGRGPAERLAEAGYAGVRYGENLGRRAASAAEMVAGWMLSPAHRATLLDPIYTSAGVGVSGSGVDAYWAQLFIRSGE